MSFRTVEDLERFVGSLSPRRSKRLSEFMNHELTSMPSDGEPPLARDADTTSEAERYRLRQAAALLRAAQRLAAEEP